jgi:hypothetical protein
LVWRALAGGIAVFTTKVSSAEAFTIVFWLLPIFIAGGGVILTVAVWYERLTDYLYFVTNSPGPGMTAVPSDKRSVDLFLADQNINVISGDTIQHALVASLQEKKALWVEYRFHVTTVVILGLAVICCIIVYLHIAR